MKRTICMLFAVAVCLAVSIPVFAASISSMTDENTYVDESGNIYTYQDGKVYQLIDGKLYEVVNGNQQQSITDMMRNRPGSEKPDAETMERVSSTLHSTIGLGLSVCIYIFFAMTAFTTVCDLAYISIPPIRELLFEGGGGTAYLHQSVMHGIANNEMARAQNAAMQGDAARAAMLQNQAMRSEHEGQYRDANWFGNKEAMEKSRGRTGRRCLISRELQSILNSGQFGGFTNGATGVQAGQSNRNIILMYLKRRSVSIVVIVAVFMLLVTSTVFTDFGFDIGNMIYRFAAKLLGF